jgi:hypothetical protein
MTTLNKHALTLMLAFMATLFAGCATKDRGLDPSGVYGGDKILYEADAAILEAKDGLDAILAWADRNAAYIATDEDAAGFVESVRDNRSRWLREALAARDAYELVKGQEQLGTLQGKLAILSRALALYRMHATQSLQETEN